MRMACGHWPAHYGPGRYAQGTDATGFMGVAGRVLLQEMERFNMILDATHLCDDSFWEALDHFTGRFGPAITIAGHWSIITVSSATNSFGH